MTHKTTVLIAISATAVAATLVTGLTGWTLHHGAVAGFSLGEALYLTSLAFVGDGIYAWPNLPDVSVLRLTRWLGFLAALSALLSVIGLTVGAHFRRAWARHVRRRALVLVGASTVSLRMAAERAADRPITMLDSPMALHRMSAVRLPPGTIAVPIDPDDIDQIRSASGWNPDTFLFGDDDPMANLARASRLAAEMPMNGKPSMLLRIEKGIVARDLELLAPELKTARLLSADASIARALVTVLGLVDLAWTRGQSRVHVALIGLGGRNLALAEELALRCHHPDLGRLQLSCLDRDLEAAHARLRRERPFLARACDLRLHALDGLECCDPDTLHRIARIEASDPLTAIIVDVGDTTDSTAIAMRLAQLQQEAQILRSPILVRSSHAPDPVPGALTCLTGGITLFGGNGRASAQIEMDALHDELAAALHARWLEGLPPDRRAGQAWSELPSSMRRANERAALFAVDLFRGAGLVPDGFADPAGLRLAQGAAVLPLDRLTELARIEHNRWIAERAAEGYRLPDPGGPRDDERKRHPAMVAFDALPPGEPEKDRANVVALLEAGVKRGQKAPRAPRWRRRVRVGVMGPLAPDDASIQSAADAFQGYLGSHVPNLDDMTLEVLTPNAPGFDRLAAKALLQVWLKASGRKGWVLKIGAASTRHLDTAAKPHLPHGVHPEVQTATLDAVAGLVRHLDNRPLNCSDAMLAHESARFEASVDETARHIGALSDLLIVSTRGGQAASTARAALQAADGGVRVIDVTPGAAQKALT